ncbi:MAG: RES domain-containing protein [Bacteroidota bacterium]
MYLYRINSCKYSKDLSGTGGLYAPGRWHYQGTRIIYFSEHISLAKLEILANSTFLSKKMCLITVHVEDTILVETLSQNELPENWASYPHPDELKQITKLWIEKSSSVLLKVSSAQSSAEFNYLFNPVHRDVAQIRLLSCEEITFDNRLKLFND